MEAPAPVRSLPALGPWIPVRDALLDRTLPQLSGAGAKLLLALLERSCEYVPAAAAGKSGGARGGAYGLSEAWHKAEDVRPAAGLSRPALLDAGRDLAEQGLAERRRKGRGYAYRLTQRAGPPPDLQRGRWTKLPRVLIRRVLALEGSGAAALRLTLAALRQTVGFQRREAWVSLSLFARRTGLSKRSVPAGLRAAAAAGLLARRARPEGEGRPAAGFLYRLRPSALKEPAAGEDRERGGPPSDRKNPSPPSKTDRKNSSGPPRPDRKNPSHNTDPFRNKKSNRALRLGTRRGSPPKKKSFQGCSDVGRQDPPMQKRSSARDAPKPAAEPSARPGAKAARILLSAGVDGRAAKRLARSHTPKRVLEVVTHAQRREDLRNPPGWICKALECGYDLLGESQGGDAPSSGENSGAGRTPSHGENYRRHEVERFKRGACTEWHFQATIFDEDSGEQLYRYRDPRQHFSPGTLVKTKQGTRAKVVEHRSGGRVEVRSQEDGAEHVFELQVLRRLRRPKGSKC